MKRKGGSILNTATHVLRRTFRAALDIALPPICRGCGHRILPHEDRPLCFACIDSVPQISPNDILCPVCGLPDAVAGSDGRCRHCLPEGPLLRLACGVRYAGTATVAIDRLKYGGREEYAELLAGWMLWTVEVLDPDRTGILVPVPLHPARKRERGYNQAENIAQELLIQGGDHSRTLAPDLLKRIRPTPTQTRLTRAERSANVAGAFILNLTAEAAAERTTGRKIILVDDVATTGATLVACAKALKNLPSNGIVAACAARANLQFS